jgi:hypothetical protein
MRKGDIHSHHSMGAYFSPTDWADVAKNSEIFDWLLSIVVSTTSNWVGKIITRASFSSKFSMIDEQRVPFTMDAVHEEGDIVLSFDLNMGNCARKFNVSDIFLARIEQLESNKLRKAESYQTGKILNNNYAQWAGGSQRGIPFSDQIEKEEEIQLHAWNQKVNEFMKRWLAMDVTKPVGNSVSIKDALRVILVDVSRNKEAKGLQQFADLLVDYFEEAYSSYFATPEDLTEFDADDVVEHIKDKLDKYAQKNEFANVLFTEMDVAEFFEDDDD